MKLKVGEYGPATAEGDNLSHFLPATFHAYTEIATFACSSTLSRLESGLPLPTAREDKYPRLKYSPTSGRLPCRGV